MAVRGERVGKEVDGENVGDAVVGANVGANVGDDSLSTQICWELERERNISKHATPFLHSPTPLPPDSSFSESANSGSANSGSLLRQPAQVETVANSHKSR